MNSYPAEFFNVLYPLALTLAMLCAAGCSGQPAKTPSTASDSREWTSTEELKFSDFFKLPVGPKGLEPTPRLLSLDGKRVRVTGYMVQEEEPQPGLFILTPAPTFITEVEDGPADYLPPASLFVHLPPTVAGKIVKYAPGHWSLIGTLRVGGQEEPNGRVSHVRLVLDEPVLIRSPDGQPPIFADAGGPLHRH